MAEKTTKGGRGSTPTSQPSTPSLLTGMTYKKLPVNATPKSGKSMADLQFDKEAKKIIAQVFKIIENLSKKDVQTWKSASQAARQVMFPNRVALYDLFTWPLSLDAHVKFLQRKMFVMLASAKFQIKDGDKVDKKAMALYKKSWYADILSLAWRYIETPWWGFTVLQLNDCDPKKQTINLQLIPRKHIVPEHGAWVKYQSTTGYNFYRDTPDMDYMIEIGQRLDLGWFDNLAPLLLYKRNALTFWAEFGESYGMPIAHAQTNSRDPKKKDELENWLKKFGSKKYLITDLADKLNLLENHMGDAGEKVYKMMIEEIDNQMTMQVLLQTMTSAVGKNGSRAQAIVHQDGEDELREAMRTSWANFHTEVMLPFHAKHGMLKEGLTYELVDDIKIDPNRLLADEFIFSIADFTDETDEEELVEYLQEAYRVPINKLKKAVVQDPDDPFEDDTPAPPAPKGGAKAKAPKNRVEWFKKLHAQIQAQYNHKHEH